MTPSVRALASKSRRAAILTLFVFLLPVLLIMLGFSVDMAYMQLVQTELRLAADNSVRVAADRLSHSENELGAATAGVDVAREFTVAGKPLLLRTSDFEFGRAKTDASGAYRFDSGAFPPNAVRLKAVRNEASRDGRVPLFFGQLIGYKDFAPQALSTAAFANVDICLVLDRSTSMKFTVTSRETGMSFSDRRFCKPPPVNSRWLSLEKAAQVFTQTLRFNTADEQLSIVTFASDLEALTPGLCGSLPAATLDMPLSENLDIADRTMRKLSQTVWNGNTHIAAGMLLGITELTGPRSRGHSDKVMIVLTDGFQTEGDALAAATAAASKQIVVHAITFGPEGDQAQMQKVAAAGNGEHAHAADEETLKKILTRFSAQATLLVQ